MYDPNQVVEAMRANNALLIGCFLGNVVFALLYFAIGVYLTLKHKIYVLPFIGAALFFWHDLTYVLDYKLWFETYTHWWFQLTWFALVGTVAFEAFLIQQFIKFGHKELFPDMSMIQFAAMTMGAVFGIGAIWWLIKAALDDDLYLVTFAITAIFSVPFHTALMLRRRSSAGQSIAMELCVIVIFAAVSLAFVVVAPSLFKTIQYLAFYVTFNVWCLFNIW
ncbi:MAG: hypothetical protein ABWZ40_02815, partial [Caulobacterales bacterium]